MTTIAQEIDGLRDVVRFELVPDPRTGYQSAQTTARSHTTRVTSDLEDSAVVMHRSANNYETTEAENTSTAESTGGHK